MKKFLDNVAAGIVGIACLVGLLFGLCYWIGLGVGAIIAIYCFLFVLPTANPVAFWVITSILLVGWALNRAIRIEEN